MKKICGLMLLCGAMSLPAMAQMTPTETNLDQSAAQMEIRNARGDQLTDVSAQQAAANALQRCQRLPDFYRSDCEARVKGEGELSGTVLGGGIVRESRTTMPERDLNAAKQDITPVQLPAH